MLKTRLISLLSFLLFAFTVNAHPGHDHSHWTSGVIHAAFFITLGLVVTIISFLIYERVIKPKLSKDKR